MKPYIFLSVLCLLLEGNSAISLSEASSIRASTSPSIELPSTIVSAIFGEADYLNPNGELNCMTLLNRNWAFQNAQATALCNEAQTSCVRYGLIQQFIMQKDINKDSAEAIKHGLSLGLEEVRLKLLGCAIAVEAVAVNAQSLIEQAGFAPALSPSQQ